MYICTDYKPVLRIEQAIFYSKFFFSMKIVIVGTAHPFRGGLAAFNERLARQFLSEGHQVEVVTFTVQYPSILFPGKSQFSDEPIPSDLTIRRLINSVNPLTWIKTGNEIKKMNADKVIFCYWMAFMAPCFGTIARIVRSNKTRTIAMVHNMIPHEPTLLDKVFPPYFTSVMDGFVAMAESVANDVRKFIPAGIPVAVSPHPIYDHYGDIQDKANAAMRLGLHDKINYILFFGFIREYKGLDLLLEAFADKRLREFPVKLIVAGEFYENPEPYMKLIHQLKLESFIELRTIFIPDSEVRNYFSVADIVAQPYRTATQSGVSQIAYHFERPMLVTNVGGLSEIVPHGKVGYVVEPEPVHIANALFDFFTNKRAAEFTENIKTEKLKYAWSKMTAVINSLKI